MAFSVGKVVLEAYPNKIQLQYLTHVIGAYRLKFPYMEMFEPHCGHVQALALG